MFDALSAAARGARIASGVRQIEVATRAGVGHSTISRFESGAPTERIEAIVHAYEAECGLEPGTLWWEAVERAFPR